MRRPVQHRPSGPDGARHLRHRGDGAGGSSGPIDEGGVEADVAAAVRNGAPASVEKPARLQVGDGRLDGVQGATTGIQDRPAGCERGGESPFGSEAIGLCCGALAGAPVHDQQRSRAPAHENAMAPKLTTLASSMFQCS